MSESITTLDNGKYEIHNVNGVISVKRHGEDWRDLSGDNLFYHLLTSHTEREQDISELIEFIDKGLPFFSIVMAKKAEALLESIRNKADAVTPIHQTKDLTK